jgi:extracellular sulfatase Sulf
MNCFNFQVRHGDNYEKDYYPDLITNDSLAFFRQTKQENSESPVLMVMSYPGPHGPEDSAPQFADLFFNVTTHQ